MAAKRPTWIVARGTELFVFMLAYYTPCLIESSNLALSDTHVRALLSSALAVPAVHIELIRNFGSQLLSLALCYVAVTWVAGHVASATGVRSAVLRWSLLLATWLFMVAGNHLLFPLSNYSVPLDAIAGPGIAAVAGSVLLAAAVVAFLRAFSLRRLAIGATLSGIVGISVGAAFWSPGTGAGYAEPRNIIIVGIDSLSAHMMQTARRELPHLEALLEGGTRFERAYTPIGRTFPAWVSLLSGLSPAEHGAVFNLRDVERVKREGLVTQDLSEAGYRTILAIDERRFSNLDESFGFDRVVGPRVGALDFVLQRLNDAPLTNLLLQVGLAQHLLPFSYLNVASTANYDANGFVDEALAATEEATPLFLAVHFESAHFPFKTRRTIRRFHHSNAVVARHGTALTTVDAQVGRLMDGLRIRGRLDDALVIVLSDHGESLGEVELATTYGGEVRELVTFGHGSQLLSEHQSRIVLGLVRYRNGHASEPASLRSDQVSLTDLRTVIERYARTGEVMLEPGGGCMTVETGVRLSALSNYRALDQAEVAKEGAGAYEIDYRGRLRLREDGLVELVNAKDVGWRCRDRLTYYSSKDGRYFTYRILDDGQSFKEVEVREEDVERIEAYRARLRNVAHG